MWLAHLNSYSLWWFSDGRKQQNCDQQPGISSTEIKPKSEGKEILLNAMKYKWSKHTMIKLSVL